MGFVFTSVSFAQTYKLDEFGQADDADLKDRVNWIFTFLNHSEPVTAYVIVYGAVDRQISDSEQTELLVRIRHSIARSPDHEKRITTMFGGLRKDETAEVYIVPEGGEPPVPTWTIANSGGKKEALLWTTSRFHEEDGVLEDFVNRAVLYRIAEEESKDQTEPPDADYNGPAYTLPDESVPVTTEDEPETAPETITETNLQPEIKSPSIEIATQAEPTPALTAEDLEEIRFSWIQKEFGAAVIRRDGAHGVMIYYADDQFYDISRLEPFIEHGRDRIAEKAGIDPALIQVTFGGYRGRAQIEYYIVPEDGIEPEGRPEER